jgi:hypothetical protein
MYLSNDRSDQLRNCIYSPKGHYAGTVLFHLYYKLTKRLSAMTMPDIQRESQSLGISRRNIPAEQ